VKEQILLIFLLQFFCSIAKATSGDSAFESLVAAAGGTDLAVTFDGYTPSGREGLVGRPVGAAGMIPVGSGVPVKIADREQVVPLPVFAGTGDSELGLKANERTVLDTATERPAVDRALKKLASIKSGKELVEFMDSEGVTLKWKILGAIGSEPNYAETCRPDACGGEKVIFLNSFRGGGRDFKDLFLNPNPTFLAVTIAHELTHLSDFKDIKGVPSPGTQAHLFLELNGWSAGVYVYHQLLISGVAPKPNSPEENRDIQLIRLDLAIRDYMNGGKRPVVADFNKVLQLGGLGFDEYVGAVTRRPRKGSTSLAGVVSHVYGLNDSFADLQKPPSSASDIEKASYKQAKKIKKSLDLSTATYIKWRKATVDAPPPPPPSQPHNPWHHQPGGDDDGGGSGGGSDGATGIDVDDWHPTPGTGDATWD